MMHLLLRKIPRPSAKAAWLYLGGFACLALTALMNRHAGVSQGATEEGRQLLGAAAIVIDFVGIVVFGSIAGNLLGLSGKLTKAMGVLVLLVTIGCALFSITSIMSFVASEWLSVAESRKANIEAVKQRQTAGIQAAKERREAQERLAKSGLGMMQAQLNDASKKEKRILGKDFAKGASELISELGKENSKPVETSQEIAMRPDGGAEVASWLLNVPERTWQVTRIAALAVLLIVLKLFAFPLGGYYWGRKSALTFATIDVTPAAVTDTVPEPIRLEPAKPLLQITKAAETKQGPTPETPPELSPEWRLILDGLDFFAPRKGALRPPLKREVLGYHLLAWMFAYGRIGEYTADQVAELYNEFCLAAWREQGNSINVAKGELREAARKIKKDSIIVRDSKSPTLWTINPIPVNRVRETLIKRNLLRPSPVAADPKKPEAAEAGAVPFAVFQSSGPPVAPPAQAANDDRPAPAPRKALGGLAELSRYVPDLEGLRRLERQEKRQWQAKAWMPHRKQQNRMKLTRAA